MAGKLTEIRLVAPAGTMADGDLFELTQGTDTKVGLLSELYAYIKKKIQDEAATLTTLTSASGVVTVDFALGDYFTLTLTENITSWVFNNVPNSGAKKCATKFVRLVQHASAAKTVAFPGGFDWPGGTPGVMSTGLGAKDDLTITTIDGGTLYSATLANTIS